MKTFAMLVLALALPVMPQQSDRSRIVSSARIYGYKLTEGNWIYTSGSCASIPHATVRRYSRESPGEAASAFTAILLRNGQVYIVPVLYHGATPFVPAPKNPRNVALFNSVVAASSGAKHDWLGLASCYSEMTGGKPDLGGEKGIAGEPSPMVHMDAQEKTVDVTLADRNREYSYRLWSLRFAGSGKLISVGIEEQGVNAAKPQAIGIVQHSQSAAPARQARWEPVANPPQLSSKFVPDSPSPMEKMISESSEASR